jgi:hypothetical protein
MDSEAGAPSKCSPTIKPFERFQVHWHPPRSLIRTIFNLQPNSRFIFSTREYACNGQAGPGTHVYQVRVLTLVVYWCLYLEGMSSLVPRWPAYSQIFGADACTQVEGRTRKSGPEYSIRCMYSFILNSSSDSVPI